MTNRRMRSEYNESELVLDGTSCRWTVFAMRPTRHTRFQLLLTWSWLLAGHRPIPAGDDGHADARGHHEIALPPHAGLHAGESLGVQVVKNGGLDTIRQAVSQALLCQDFRRQRGHDRERHSRRHPSRQPIWFRRV